MRLGRQDLAEPLEMRSSHLSRAGEQSIASLDPKYRAILPLELQRTVRLCIVKDQLTAHDIANRILRKENFMIALVNHGLLPLQVNSAPGR